MTKITFTFALLITLFIASCKGEKGDMGPAGPQGPQGVSGAQGPAGNDLIAPKIYDFTFRFGKSMPTSATYSKIPTPGQYDFMVAYITTGKTTSGGVTAIIRTPLPFRGVILYDSKSYYPIDIEFSYGASGNVYINSYGNTFDAVDIDFRVVVIKGSRGVRIDVDRYRNYENLKKDFNLKD